MLPRGFTRREILKAGAMATVGSALGPALFFRDAGAQANGKRVLVVVFQRGAVDGLSMVVPYEEARYFDLRPNIAIPPPGAEGGGLALGDGFAFNPGLGALSPFFSAGELAVVHAVGSPDPTRSHFDAQDYMETGFPGVKSAADGWVNRHLQSATGSASVFRALALDSSVPRALSGSAEVLAVSSLSQLTLGSGPRAEIGSRAVEAMYKKRRDVLGDAVRSALEGITIAEGLDVDSYQPGNGAEYPNSELAGGLREIAQLVKADVGLEVAFLNVGGWDTHAFQGASQGQLAGLLGGLAASLAAFRTDLGSAFEDVCVLTLSEFGRTVAENGSGGSDHGHGNVMLVFGGTVSGGKVYGEWPGLGDAQLYEGRDLAVTTDFRTVAAEVVERHLGNTDVGTVFPGFSYGPETRLGLIG